MSNLNFAHRRSLAVLAMVVAATTAGASRAATGEENFKTSCTACHTIGSGKLVGPDLAGVTTRRTEDWLIKFIKSPKAVIDAGDADAAAMATEFKMVMPDQPYTDAEIKDIVAFIGSKSGAPAVATPPPVVREATPAEVERGGRLFQGLERLRNGGPACNSCHHVKNDAVIGGGVLAKELTTVFSTMGTPGINAILGKPPFPVMAQAYELHPLTDDESAALVGFLQDADKKHQLQQPRDYGFRLVWSGAAALLPLMGLYTLIWRRRKVSPVNEKIFARQVKGEDDVHQ